MNRSGFLLVVLGIFFLWIAVKGKPGLLLSTFLKPDAVEVA